MSRPRALCLLVSGLLLVSADARLCLAGQGPVDQQETGAGASLEAPTEADEERGPFWVGQELIAPTELMVCRCWVTGPRWNTAQLKIREDVGSAERPYGVVPSGAQLVVEEVCTKTIPDVTSMADEGSPEAQVEVPVELCVSCQVDGQATRAYLSPRAVFGYRNEAWEAYAKQVSKEHKWGQIRGALKAWFWVLVFVVLLAAFLNITGLSGMLGFIFKARHVPSTVADAAAAALAHIHRILWRD
jgi:hypothetical protein